MTMMTMDSATATEMAMGTATATAMGMATVMATAMATAMDGTTATAMEGATATWQQQRQWMAPRRRGSNDCDGRRDSNDNGDGRRDGDAMSTTAMDSGRVMVINSVTAMQRQRNGDVRHNGNGRRNGNGWGVGGGEWDKLGGYHRGSGVNQV